MHGRAFCTGREHQDHGSDPVVSVRAILQKEACHLADLQDLSVFFSMQLYRYVAAERHGDYQDGNDVVTVVSVKSLEVIALGSNLKWCYPLPVMASVSSELSSMNT